MTEKSSNSIFDENYPKILADIAIAAEKSGRRPEDIILLGATKTVSAEAVNHAISGGLGYIGENKVQELLDKWPYIEGEVHRHFIGHLQTNKVKYIIDKVEMIESVHSVKLAEEINKRARAIDKIMDILLEVNIGAEESKSGFAPSELESAIKAISKLENVKVRGLMTIPPVSEGEELKKYFTKMQELFVDIRDKNIDNICMDYLSMGMSSDFAEAILCGANIVRVGTSLFGARYYANNF